jgi:hypothetical protein
MLRATVSRGSAKGGSVSVTCVQGCSSVAREVAKSFASRGDFVDLRSRLSTRLLVCTRFRKWGNLTAGSAISNVRYTSSTPRDRECQMYGRFSCVLRAPPTAVSYRYDGRLLSEGKWGITRGYIALLRSRYPRLYIASYVHYYRLYLCPVSLPSSPVTRRQFRIPHIFLAAA